MRFINHFERVGRMNVEFVEKLDSMGRSYCAIETIEEIEAGEEILADYGDSYCESFGIGKFSSQSEGENSFDENVEFSDDGKSEGYERDPCEINPENLHKDQLGD